MAFDEPAGEYEQDLTRPGAATPPEAETVPAREPLFVLIIGIVLYVSLLVFSWVRVEARTPSQAFQNAVPARLGTYMVTAVLSWEAQGTLPSSAQISLGGSPVRMAQLWSTVSQAYTAPDERGRAALNAAALYGVADRSAAAQAQLIRAARLDPAQATAYEALLPLYRSTPQPAVFTPKVEALLNAISSGPILRARQAQVAGQGKAAVIAALRPGAEAGVRVLIAYGLIAVIFLGVVVMACVLYLTRFSRITGIVHDAAHEPRVLPPWGIGTALILISLTYLLTMLCMVVIARMLPGRNIELGLVIGAVSTIVSVVVVLGLFLLAMGRAPWEWSVFGWRPTRMGVRYGLAALVVILPLVWLASYLSAVFTGGKAEPHPLIPILLSMRNGWVIFFTVLITVVMAPLVEETLYRGILFRALDKHMPLLGAALLSGFMFAVQHGQVNGVLPIMILGSVFALLTRRSGSLVASAVAHAGFNGIVTANVLLLNWALHGPGA